MRAQQPFGTKRAVALALAGLLVGCGHVQTETRVERGPTLRSFEREGPASPGGLQVRASARWPKLELAFSTYEVCRNEKVEEYVEERTTEVTAPGAGPAVGTGVTTTLLGLGLLAGSNLFSSQPDTHTIDATGHYGPSTRQVVRGWSIPLLVIGVPALAVAAVQLVQTGERTETHKAEQVVSALDSPCHIQPASGKLSLEGKARPPAPLDVKDGRLELSPEQAVALDLSAMALDAREVDLPAQDVGRVDAFRACARALPLPAEGALAALDPMELAERLDAAHLCRKVPDAPAVEAEQLYGKELAARRERGEASPSGPRFERFEDALAAYAPALRFTPDSPDLEKLEHPESLEGQAARVQGLLVQWVAPNIAAVQVGPRRVWLFAEGRRTGELSAGSRVEAVAVVAGRQTLGSVELPLLRAVWLQPAM